MQPTKPLPKCCCFHGSSRWAGEEPNSLPGERENRSCGQGNRAHRSFCVDGKTVIIFIPTLCRWAPSGFQALSEAVSQPGSRLLDDTSARWDWSGHPAGIFLPENGREQAEYCTWLGLNPRGWKDAPCRRQAGRYGNKDRSQAALIGACLCHPDNDAKENTEATVSFSPEHVNPSEREGAGWFRNSHNLFQALQSSRCCFLSLFSSSPSLLKTKSSAKSFSLRRTNSSLVLAFMRVGE